MPFTKCPQCGYNEVPEVKTHHATMNQYVNVETKELAVMNHASEKLELNSGEGDNKKVTKWTLKSVWDKEQGVARNKRITELRAIPADKLSNEQKAELTELTK
jgi:hypothetical protein